MALRNRSLKVFRCDVFTVFEVAPEFVLTCVELLFPECEFPGSAGIPPEPRLAGDSTLLINAAVAIYRNGAVTIVRAIQKQLPCSSVRPIKIDHACR